MSDEITNYYGDLLPDDVNNEITERLKNIEVHQEEVISNVKNTLPFDLNNLNII